MLHYYFLVLVVFVSPFAVAEDGEYAINITSLTVDVPLGSGNFCTEDLTLSPDTSLSVNESDVKFYLYTRTLNESEINTTNVTSVGFNATKDTVFLVHGWTGSYQGTTIQALKDAYLESRDVNAIIVDWEEVSNRNYVNARYAVQGIGEQMAAFIQFMTVTVGLDLNKTGLVGHSLGAHVCGAAGDALNSSVNRIIGLDPAGPLFLITSSSDKLESGDAQFVQIIHTCAGILGYPFSLGDADYWPNGGGVTQPGCSASEAISCSHIRAYDYYSESLISGNFLAKECSNDIAYSLGFCSSSSEAFMGEDADDRSTGDFFLDTNSEEPYAMG